MRIEDDVLLAPFTSLKIGGRARYFLEVRGEEELPGAVAFAQERRLPLAVLGEGSNVLVADAGFGGLVIRIALEGGFAWTADRRGIAVSAGFGWDALVKVVAEQGVCGMECLAGIPGLVGGAPIQNIGAYGQEAGDVIGRVRAFDRETGQFVELPRAACGFGYRRSLFNSTALNRYIVTRVDFEFDRSEGPKLDYPDVQRHFAGKPAPSPMEVYHAVREIRAAKGMLIDPANPTADSTSAGSFFKNPVVPMSALERIAVRLGIRRDEIRHWPVTAHPEAGDPGGTVAGGVGETKLPAAWLIEQAGFAKGFSMGPVGISTRHTLALTNRTGTATCAELLALRDRIVDGVEGAFGIRLEQEPVFLR